MKTNHNGSVLEDFRAGIEATDGAEKSCGGHPPKLRNVTPDEVSPDDTIARPNGSVQWANAFGRSDLFIPVGKTCRTLAAGMYDTYVSNGTLCLRSITVQTDTLITLPDGVPKQICDEIADFWTREEIFTAYGFLHRRGYLLYGAAGCGKTAIVQLVAQNCISKGNVVLLCKNPGALISVISSIREVEPERKLVCIFEDIDALISRGGEDEILNLLDGENQINHVLNLATTNYPERLDRRIVARPRRFDRVLKIDMPSDETRRVYLQKKLKIGKDDLQEWVSKTSGLSFAALAEVVISVKCLGNSLDDTVELLRNMAVKTATSDDYSTVAKAGFEIGIDKCAPAFSRRKQ